MPDRHAAILSIGDELTLGQNLDTNARWLSARLAELAIEVIEHRTVGDDRDAIAAALRDLCARAAAEPAEKPRVRDRRPAPRGGAGRRRRPVDSNC